MMQELNKLQEVVFCASYYNMDEYGDIKTGRVHVLAIKDISYATPEPVQQSAAKLSQAKYEHSNGLNDEETASYQAVDESI